MGETKHTQGPWEIMPRYAVRGKYAACVAVAPKDGPLAVLLPPGGSEDIRQANARLIAAAPELYEACKVIRDTCPADPDINGEWLAAWNSMLAAIAKAEGRQ